jgi:hypothetical protein
MEMTGSRSFGRQRAITLGALLAGVALLLACGEKQRWTPLQLAPFAIVAAAFLPPTRRFIRLAQCRLNRWGRHAPVRTAAVISTISFLVLVIQPLAAGWTLYPRSHDEQMEMVQVQMLARGRLYMPAHPLGEFFESFFVTAEPVYGSVYFPGAALAFVPAIWLKLPYFFLPAFYSAVAVGVLFGVLRILIDGSSAALGALLLMSNTTFRALGLGVVSHNVMLLLGLCCVLAWLRWMNRPLARWAALAGLFAGWAAITRPVDAICYVLPLALLSLPRIFNLPARQKLASILSALAAAGPFIALQLIFNVHVTGHLLQTPYQVYLDRDQPQTAYGFFSFDPNVWPQSRLLQKSIYYDQFLRPAIAQHQPDRVLHTFFAERFPLLLQVDLPHPILQVLLPLGLLGLTTRRRLAVWLILPALAMGYALNAFLLSHYLVIWAPPLILMLALTPVVARRHLRPRVKRAMLRTLVILMIVAGCISAQPGINPNAIWRWPTPLLDDVQQKLSHLPHMPAVVLFRYDPRKSFDQEPVYNTDVAWPDDAAVIRAHDLGEANVAIARYYAERQPRRYFYRYDQATGQIEALGSAAEFLAKCLKPTSNP